MDDSKKIKIIIAGVIGLAAVILIGVNFFGGSKGDNIDAAALAELEKAAEPVHGGPQMAPGGDDTVYPDE